VDDWVKIPDVAKGLPNGSVELWFKVNSWNPGRGGMYLWAGVQGDPGSNSGDGINLGAHPYITTETISYLEYIREVGVGPTVE
jgi:hypothetical protein